MRITDLKPNQKVIVFYMQLKQKPKYKVKEISQDCDIAKEHVREHLKELEMMGLIILIKYKNELEAII
jgi:predicted ArsR family transcriptional regulator